MTLSPNINNLEKDKFVESVDGDTAVRTIDVSEWIGGDVGNKIEVTYPSATQEVYTYKNGVTTYKVVTVNYTTSSKEFISDIERTA